MAEESPPTPSKAPDPAPPAGPAARDRQEARRGGSSGEERGPAEGDTRHGGDRRKEGQGEGGRGDRGPQAPDPPRRHPDVAASPRAPNGGVSRYSYRQAANRYFRIGRDGAWRRPRGLQSKQRRHYGYRSRDRLHRIRHPDAGPWSRPERLPPHDRPQRPRTSRRSTRRSRPPSSPGPSARAAGSCSKRPRRSWASAC